MTFSSFQIYQHNYLRKNFVNLPTAGATYESYYLVFASWIPLEQWLKATEGTKTDKLERKGMLKARLSFFCASQLNRGMLRS